MKQPVKLSAPGLIFSTTRHAIDNDWEVYTGKNWMFGECRNFQQHQTETGSGKDDLQQGLAYAREHEDLPFYLEESRYREVPPFELALQDWYHEPAVTHAELQPSSDPAFVLLRFSVQHPVTLKLCQVEVFEGAGQEFLFSGGARIISRTGTCYGLLIPKHNLENRTSLNLKFTLKSMSESVSSWMFEKVPAVPTEVAEAV